MSTTAAPLTYKRIFLFWLPLAVQWLMMAAEGPLVAAIIARMVAPKFNLAAYGVAVSIALIIEAPIIMLMSAATALVRTWSSYLQLRRYAHTLCWLVTLGIVLICIPPVFEALIKNGLDLEPEVARLTHLAVVALIPWPGMIGYRRFLHGILISHDRTRYVAYGTAIRLTGLALTGFLLFSLSPLTGSLVGAIAMTVAVVLEAAVTRYLARGVLARLQAGEYHEEDEDELSLGFFARFYAPLAMTSILVLGMRPIITFFVSQSRMALESLAVLPVIHSLVFVFISLGLAYQEVGITLLGTGNKNYTKLRNFASFLAIGSFLGLGLIAFTPLAGVWFEQVSGLTRELAEFSIPPLMIMSVFPVLTSAEFFLRSILVNARKTRPITVAGGVEMGVVTGLLALGIMGFDLVGMHAAAGAMIGGVVVAVILIWRAADRVMKRPV